MKTNLDKSYTFSLRQIIFYIRNLLLIVALFYFMAIIKQDWMLAEGDGVSISSSPFLPIIPSKCIKTADRNGGGRDPQMTLADRLLLRGKIRHRKIKDLLTQEYGECFGYSIIAGLHGGGFTDVYEDINGEPFVTITVSYQQTYKPYISGR